MRYLALLFGAEDAVSEPGSDAWNEELAAYERFDEVAGDAVLGGEALAPSLHAVTIRYPDVGHPGDAEPVVSDGPFTESTEVVGGFYVLEADDLDHAIELARHLPAAADGAVELRPLVEWGQEPANDGLTRYLAVLAGPEAPADEPGTPEWDAAVAEHERFAKEAGDAALGGGALHPAATATTVRVRDGELLLTDGPFTESTEIIGGLYLLAAASADDALALARRIPMGPGGRVEVRPLVEFEE